MTLKCITPTIPVWADQIEVDPARASRLMVRGFGRSSSPRISLQGEAVIEGFSPRLNKPMHLQFANLRSTGELVDFIRTYGPIWGRLIGKSRRRDANREITGKEDLLVREDLDRSWGEQRLFRSAVELLSQLHEKRQDRIRLRNLILQIGTLYPQITAAEKRSKASIRALAATLRMADPRRRNDATQRPTPHSNAILYNTVSGAHGVLCYLLNRFPLHLFPCSEGAVELPTYDREGILPLLYYLLRRDYHDEGHLIKICMVCAEAFKPHHGDPPCCSLKHYKRYNDRLYYLRKRNKEAVS